MTGMADAYAQGAEAWADGPARIYGRLAQELVAFSPFPLTGRHALDLGSGTGVGSRAARAAGALVTETDLAVDMLLFNRVERPPAVAGDALALPFRRDAFDVVIAPFSLNHLDDPSSGVREAGRVAPTLLASTYATDDDHPVKGAVETALTDFGWHRPDWYDAVKKAMTAWGTVDAATAVVEGGGLRPVDVEHRSVPFPELGARDMVAWRLGMAPCSPFVAALPSPQQDELVRRALDLLGPRPPAIVRRVILIAAQR